MNEELSALESQGLLRELRVVDGPQGPVLNLDGRRVLNVSSNDYLGLASHPLIRRAAEEALARCGWGSGASRFISGNHPEHQAVEKALRDLHRTSGALLFSSGYHANIGLIPALVGETDLLLSDELNHASIIDGCRLAHASRQIYPHRDAQAVAEILRAKRHQYRRVWVLSESIFSMEGTVAPLRDLRDLCNQFDARLYLDEAHAVGAFGPNGAGMAAQQEVEPDLLVGTLSKALGSYGGYAAGAAELIAYLLQTARSGIYTTALPAAAAAAGHAALQIAAGQEGRILRKRLGDRIHQLRQGLADRDWLLPGAGQSAIFPVVYGEADLTMRACGVLLEQGVFAQGIRPPTVPNQKSRLRIALRADHTATQVEAVLTTLTELAATGTRPVGCST